MFLASSKLRVSTNRNSSKSQVIINFKTTNVFAHRQIFICTKEQSFINANKEFIEIFEPKIKDRIAKVWVEKKKEYQVEVEVLSMVAEDHTEIF